MVNTKRAPTGQAREKEADHGGAPKRDREAGLGQDVDDLDGIAVGGRHRAGVLQHEGRRIDRHERHDIAGDGELRRLDADLQPDSLAMALPRRRRAPPAGSGRP